MERKTFYIEENDISDGYHTFRELYDYRMAYNALWVNEIHKSGKSEKYKLHKSFRHHDNELCFGGGWFIVSLELPTGQISNHYKSEFWHLFQIPASEKSILEYDGHTPDIAKERLFKHLKLV